MWSKNEWQSAQVPASGQLQSAGSKSSSKPKPAGAASGSPPAPSPSSDACLDPPLAPALSNLSAGQHLGSVVVDRSPTFKDAIEDDVSRADIYARLRRLEESFCKEQELRRAAENRATSLEKQMTGLLTSACSSERVDGVQRLVEEERTARQVDLAGLRSGLEAARAWQASGEVETLVHREVQQAVRQAVSSLQDALNKDTARRFDTLAASLRHEVQTICGQGARKQQKQQDEEEDDLTSRPTVAAATAASVQQQREDLDDLRHRQDLLQADLAALSETVKSIAEADGERITAAIQAEQRIESSIHMRMNKLRAEWERLLEDAREEDRKLTEDRGQALARSICGEMEKSVVSQAVAESRAEARILLAGELEVLCSHLREDNKEGRGGDHAQMLLLDQHLKALQKQVEDLQAKQLEADAKDSENEGAKDMLARLAHLVQSRLEVVERTMQSLGNQVLTQPQIEDRDRLSMSLPSVPVLKQATPGLRSSTPISPQFGDTSSPLTPSLLMNSPPQSLQVFQSRPARMSTDLAPGICKKSNNNYVQSSCGSYVSKGQPDQADDEEDTTDAGDLTAREERIKAREDRLQHIEDSLRTCGVEFKGSTPSKTSSLRQQRNSSSGPQKRRSEARSPSPIPFESGREAAVSGGTSATLLGRLRPVAAFGAPPGRRCGSMTIPCNSLKDRSLSAAMLPAQAAPENPQPESAFSPPHGSPVCSVDCGAVSETAAMACRSSSAPQTDFGVMEHASVSHRSVFEKGARSNGTTTVGPSVAPMSPQLHTSTCPPRAVLPLRSSISAVVERRKTYGGQTSPSTPAQATVSTTIRSPSQPAPGAAVLPIPAPAPPRNVPVSTSPPHSHFVPVLQGRFR